MAEKAAEAGAPPQTPESAEEIVELRRRANDEGSGASVAATLRLLDEVERTRALLRRIEQSGGVSERGEGDAGYCPACREWWAHKPPHKPGCELAALLG